MSTHELLFRSLCSYTSFYIPSGIKNKYGRSDFGMFSEKRISKEHISIFWMNNIIMITSIGRNPCWIKREGDIVIQLKRFSPIKLHSNDLLYLIPGHDYPYCFEFIKNNISNKRKRNTDVIIIDDDNTILPPLKRRKISNNENINKIMEIGQCTFTHASNIWNKSNGNIDLAINMLLDNKSNNDLKSINSSYFYPNYIPHCTDNKNTLKITDIGDIKEAILCTYMVDLDWLLDILPVLCIIPTIISHGSSSIEYSMIIPDTLTIIKPTMPLVYGINHGKLFVLFYSDKVRICISTANLLQIDYERKAQGLWCQDFYKKKSNTLSNGCDFEYTLCDYLNKQGINPINNLREYDFSTAKAILISSVPGYHNKGGLYLYGHMKIRKYISNISNINNSTIISQFSSIGSLSKHWINEFKTSLNGDKNIKSQLKMLWPTEEFVKTSIEGFKAGDSLCLPKKNYESKKFLKEYFYEYSSCNNRMRIPPHIKTYFSYINSNNNNNISYMILTSANMSKAAWGELQKHSTQLMIRHYEIGVLFLPKNNQIYKISNECKENENIIEFYIPYKYKNIRYYNDTHIKPWMWN